jgi:hypothetical protein
MVQQLIFVEGGLEMAEQAYYTDIRFFTTPRRPSEELDLNITIAPRFDISR